MSNTAVFIIVAAAITGGLAFQFFITWRSHQKDYREHLGPVLRSHGLQLLSSKWQGIGKTGPFPKFEVRIGRPQTRIGNIRGEYREYRLVVCRGQEKRTCTLWALLEFEMFRLKRIRWRATDRDSIPEYALSLIEN